MHTRLACDYYPNHVSPDTWPKNMERMRARGIDLCLPTEWLTLHTVKGWASGMAGDMRFPWKQFNGGSEQVLNGLIDAADLTNLASDGEFLPRASTLPWLKWSAARSVRRFQMGCDWRAYTEFDLLAHPHSLRYVEMP